MRDTTKWAMVIALCLCAVLLCGLTVVCTGTSYGECVGYEVWIFHYRIPQTFVL